MTNDNPKCPVCLTVQTGAHTCKRAKPLPSDPECKRLRESGNDLGSVYVPEPKCEHDEYSDTYWCGDRAYKKKVNYPTCPFCKPVEPSVEEIAEKLLSKFCEDDLMSELKEGIVNALRNERNRK